jgi:putative membrane protein
MMKFILRWVVNAVALYAAVALVPGIRWEGASGVNPVIGILVLALVFGLLNALLRPLLMILTCPLIILTLGFGTLLVNTVLFWLTGAIGTGIGLGFRVDGLIPAFLGALVVSLVSIAASLLFKDQE